jgi:single-strand DNA-binding protein
MVLAPPHAGSARDPSADRIKECWTVNKVLLTGRLTRDPEMRALSSGKHVTQFSVATTEYAGNGKERPEFHNIVTWDRLAEVCGRYLGKGQQVSIEGRIQTRTWDDEKGLRHWKTEIVATTVEMLSGRKKKDYAAESSADAIEAAGLAAAGSETAETGETGEESDADEAPTIPADDPIAEALAA